MTRTVSPTDPASPGPEVSSGAPVDAAPQTPEAPEAAPQAPAVIAVGPGVVPDPRTHILVVRLQVVTIEAPVGTVSNSEDLWSYLDEEPVGPRKVAALGRNGWRIGRGPSIAWPDVAEALKKTTGQSLNKRLRHMLPGKTVTIPLNEHPATVTIFTSHSDRTLSGADYPPGKDVLRISATLSPEEPWVVLVTGYPQIEVARNQPRLVAEPGKVRVDTSPILYQFDALQFQMPVRSGDFMIIGPGAVSRNASSPGAHFLVRSHDGARFETVLVLIPEVLGVPRTGGGPVELRLDGQDGGGA